MTAGKKSVFLNFLPLKVCMHETINGFSLAENILWFYKKWESDQSYHCLPQCWFSDEKLSVKVCTGIFCIPTKLRLKFNCGVPHLYLQTQALLNETLVLYQKIFSHKLSVRTELDVKSIAMFFSPAKSLMSSAFF